MANLTDVVYAITITLLEDLHTGTGTGNVTVDSVQARNEQGFPIIDRHHFRGVLKDNALRLKKLGVIKKKTINKLFGKSGGKQRKLDCSSLKTKTKDCLIYWDATARKKGSRCPEDNSLRRIEYIRAATELTGTISIRKASDTEIDALKSILKFTTRLGSERTRGSGQFILDQNNVVATDMPATKKLTISNNTSLRLLLKNTEPLCIPTSGHAGNIIHTESYIPGRTLFAALCKKAVQQTGKSKLKELFEKELSIGNAYPLPQAYGKKPINQILCVPMPNNIHKRKQGAAEEEQELRWPHWANTEGDPASLLDDLNDVDLFIKPNPQEKTTRPKGEMYLIKDENNKWRRYKQALTIRMRNQRGDPFDKEIKRGDTELFSEQRIPTNTHFLLDIYCQDDDLLTDIAQLLETPVAIGRGKAPVSVVNEKLDSTLSFQSGASGTSNEFIITAISDWIIRGDNLGFITQLNKQSLGNLLGITIEKLTDFQESEQQGSFNYVSGLPYRPFYVIRRGSSFLIETKTDIDLSSLPKNLGERNREGYGQYIINLPISLEEKAEEKQKRDDEKKAKELAKQEQALQQLLKEEAAIKAEFNQKVIDFYNTTIVSNAGNLPNERQWDELIKQYESNKNPAPNQQAIAAFSKGMLGKPAYNKLGGLNLARHIYEICQNGDGKVPAQTIIDFLQALKEHCQQEEDKS